MTQQQLADGWYKVTGPRGDGVDFTKLHNGKTHDGVRVDWLLRFGWEFEPIVVMTKAEYGALAARVAELEAENDQLRAQLAQTYQPMEDGQYPTLRVENDGYVIRQNLSNIVLPNQRMRLCRLADAAQTTHQNEE